MSLLAHVDIQLSRNEHQPGPPSPAQSANPPVPVGPPSRADDTEANNDGGDWGCNTGNLLGSDGASTQDCEAKAKFIKVS